MKIKNKFLSEKSKKWLRRHLKDEFVRLSKEEQFRSRAAYKLIEIDNKFKILGSSQSIVDLGGAPGSWAEVIKTRAKKAKIIISVDLLDIEPLKDVKTVKDDFTSKSFDQFLDKHRPFDLILSDISPNLSGNKTADFLQSQALVESALEFALSKLSAEGHFVAKYFRTGEMKDIFIKAKKNFEKISSFKPVSSRKESSEMYLICLKKRKLLN